jgi:hypothetical protein
MGKNVIEVDENDLINIALLKCDKVLTTGDKMSDCSKRELPTNRYCGACFARMIAYQYLSKNGSEK